MTSQISKRHCCMATSAILLLVALAAVALFFIKKPASCEEQIQTTTLRSHPELKPITSEAPPLLPPPKVTRLLLEVTKPPGDRREYRALELGNGMRVIVVSDPKTDKAAAALNVMTGSYHDPDELLGMAHYLEHMLFLGTAKFPGNEYEKYLAQFAGYTNAYTQSDNTCYYFALSPEGLLGGIERFAQMFIAPLFTEELNEREVNAVNSEYEGARVNENWRKYRIDQFTSNWSHPYSRFSIGNKKTLWTQPLNRSIDVRAELIKFYNAHYSANLMTLSVIGRESLNQLQEMVEKYFDPVPNKQAPISIWPDSPWGPKQLQRRIDMVPLMDIRTLTLSFPAPDYSSHFKTGTLEYIESLMKHGGPGSLLSLLRNKKWASGMYAYYDVPARGFAMFVIVFNLTPKGLDNIDDIVLHTFQYLKMLRQMGPQKWFWDELKLITETKFRFREEQDATSIVKYLAAVMPDYPIGEVWTAGHILNDFRPHLIHTFLSALVPSNVRLLTQTKANQKIVTDKEEFMDVEYAYTKIDPKLIKEWTNCEFHDELRLPLVNKFIPNSFDLKPFKNDSEGIPGIILDNEMSRVWFLQDQEFHLPHATIALEIINPYTWKSARNHNLQTLFVKLIYDLIKEKIYAATETGLVYDLRSKSNGISLLVYGYDAKFGLLFDQILDFIVNFHNSINLKRDREAFEDVKEAYTRTLNNTKDESPSSHAYSNFRKLMHSQGFTPEERLASISGLTLEDVVSYASKIFSKVRLQWVVTGNIVKEDAMELYDQGMKHFRRIQSQPLRPYEVPSLIPTQVMLPVGSNYLYNQNLDSKAQTQSAVFIYFQSEMADLRKEWIILMILDQILREPCFNILRTEEQLGYAVGCSRTADGSAYPGYRVFVQGQKHPNFTESRIHHFLQTMAVKVNNISEDDLTVHKKAVETVIMSGKSKTLWSKVWGILWDMERGTYDFHRSTEQLMALANISLHDVHNYFNTWINPESDKRKMLSIHVTSKQQVTDEVIPLPEYLNLLELVAGVGEWKKRLGYFPKPKPYTTIHPWNTTRQTA